MRMRLDVVIDGAKTGFVRLVKDITIVGSSRSCDIVIPHPHMSRRHLAIYKNGDSFVVEDLGSSNGSFIDNVQLEPRVKVEFTTYFPVRLAQEITLSLITDETSTKEFAFTSTYFVEQHEEWLSAPAAKPSPPGPTTAAAKAPTPPNPQQNTKVTELRTVSANTFNPSAPQRQKIPRRAASPSPQSGPSTRLISVVLVVMVLGVVWHIVSKGLVSLPHAKKSKRVAPLSAAAQRRKAESIPQAPAVPLAKIIPEDVLEEDYRTLAEINELFSATDKCTTDAERALCQSIRGADRPPWGVKTHQDEFVVMVDGSQYAKEARKTLAAGATEEEVWRLAAALFFLEGVHPTLDYSKIKNSLVVVALFDTTDVAPSPNTQMVLSDKSMALMRGAFGPRNIKEVRTYGIKSLDYLNKYYAPAPLKP